MTRTEKQFFTLLQGGLGIGPARLEWFRTPVEWDELFRLSREQALLGVVYDGITSLPAELRPPRAFLMNWYAQARYLEEMNRAQNAVLLHTYDLYTVQGFHPVLLKGQSMAACYPNPHRRHSGDIDWLLGEADYERAKAWLLAEGMATGENLESNNHVEYIYKGQQQEMHRECIRLFRRSDQRYLRRLTAEWFPAGIASCTIEGREVPVPPVEFNAVYLLLHIVKHLFGHGVGLRQLCDWVLFLRTHRQELDEALLAEYVRGFHLDAAWALFTRFAVVYMGASSTELPMCGTETLDARCHLLWTNIRECGNFGHYLKHSHGEPQSYLQRKYFAMLKRLRRIWQAFRILPSDAVSYFCHFLPMALHQTFAELTGRTGPGGGKLQR